MDSEGVDSEGMDWEPTTEQRVGARHLRRDLAAHLRRAGRGERFVVTVDGVPVAQLGPIDPDGAGAGLAELAAAGLIGEPRRLDRPGSEPPLPVAVDLDVSRVLDRVRGR